MGERYLRIGDLTERLPISRPTIYRMIKKATMPKPIKLGSSTVWLESEIDKWMKDLAEAR